MQTPLRITFRHIGHSPALEANIRELTGRLEKFHDRIIGCNVVVDGSSAQGKHEGKQASGHGHYAVHIEVTIPGGVINATNSPPKHLELIDAFGALRDAFENAKQQLLDFTAVH
jgi:ribosome-associated translation inhibitor RaiA